MSMAIAGTTAKTVRHLAYQQQDSRMSLAQGLEEYYRSNGSRVLRPENLSEESRDLFRSHDICHVIFGLDTTLDDEAMADTRTLLSCDVGVRRYTRYLSTTPEAKAIFKELGYGRAIWITLHAIPRILAAVGESFRMKKKWPWKPPTRDLDRSLSELRSEYGIRVI